MVEFTIETTSWENVKLFWEKWKNYDISVKTYGLNIKDKVYINTDNFNFEEEKTFGFYKDGILLGCGQIKFLSYASRSMPNGHHNIAGIQNMCTDPAYRNNGIGTAIMELMLRYIKDNHFNISILYPSLYSKLIGFYERFGYKDYKKVMLYYPFGNSIPHEKLDKIIKQIGKF